MPGITGTPPIFLPPEMPCAWTPPSLKVSTMPFVCRLPPLPAGCWLLLSGPSARHRCQAVQTGKMKGHDAHWMSRWSTRTYGAQEQRPTRVRRWWRCWECQRAPRYLQTGAAGREVK
ncbi:hypothetical protein DL89DRAFT_52250 [Linderina pennispora]|uniref:Uncharacterized protein n=1 Tax=Linderina pennispora TaxID=61395 RepID=A0A1Y1W0Q1_9FUNG|nr:uncharacterized protein DL89DRAFT_52250 [Linderina pennispora]ORX67109.1 hypothetical protein DL89DRAFT_52250 [Linderina pennispora]